MQQAILQAPAEGAKHRGNVVLTTLGQLPHPEVSARLVAGQEGRPDHLALAQVGFLVAEEEVVERQFPLALRAGQPQPGAQRQQHRRGVADRRGIGDVAAQGAAVAHLGRAQAMQQMGKGRVVVGQQRLQARVGHGTADPPSLAAILQGRLLDGVELGDARDVHHPCEARQPLGHLEPEVGAAGDDGCLGVVGALVDQLRQTFRPDEGAIAMVFDGG